jgi:hypothetical protein
MNYERKIVLAVTSLLFTGSLLNYACYRFYLDAMAYTPTDFHDLLLSIRLWVSAATLLIFIGVGLRSRWTKFVSLFSVFAVFSTYILWYFEKFEWIEGVGIQEGTPEYAKKLIEIGWFRGANAWDYIVLFSVLTLFVWLIFRNLGSYFDSPKQNMK